MLRSVVAIALRMIIAFFIGFTSMADAGEFNEVLSIGDKSPVWENLPGTDGKKHSLSDLKDKQIVVIVFTCLSCPTAVDYEERIDALAKQHAGADDKVAVVAADNCSCCRVREPYRCGSIAEAGGSRERQRVFVYLSR